MRPAHDLSSLIKWLSREDWRPLLEEVMDEHFGPAMEAFDLAFEEIDEALGGTWAMTLWGCAFEDFLTRRFEPDGRNPVEVYLQRRGWKESAAARRYMAALQTSVMSLYEVSDITPGESLRARDLIRGGEPVLVSERSATQTLKPWDRIAARIVPQGDRSILAGGVLAFTLEGSDLLTTALQDSLSRTGRRRRHPRRGQPAAATPKGWAGTDEDLQRVAPLFTTAWLFDVLPRALGLHQPTLHNSEGDEVVFHEMTFPLARTASKEEVAHRVNAVRSLRRESPTFWNWLGEAAPARPADEGENALMWNITLEDGSVVLGNIELKERTLVLSVTSAARAQRGRAMLEGALSGLVGAPLTKIQTVEQMRAARGTDRPSTVPEAEVPAEVQTQLVHAMLDRQYRALLDEPVGMLGDVSPRTASRSAKGRERIAAWLKHLENRSHHAGDRSDPMATYDFTWLWRELKVEHLRK
jgi:hypothetical protein